MGNILLFRELEKSTNTGCWSFDISTRKVFWSEKTYELHGVECGKEITPEEAIEFYFPEDREVIRKALQDCAYEGKEFNKKLRIIDTQGQLKYVESTGRAILEDGKPVKVFGTFKDISKEVKLVGSKLAMQERMKSYSSVFEKYFIVAQTDARGVILSVNQKLIDISGYSREELIGSTHKLLNSGIHKSEFFKDLWTTIKSGEAWDGLICNRKKNGDLYYVQSLIFPVFDDHNQIEKFMAVRHDVTEKVLLQKELEIERKNSEFSSQLAAIGEISAGIAHEINNPLAVIKGRIEQLKRTDLTEEMRERNLESLDKASDRITKIIRGLGHMAQKSRSDEFEVKNLASVLKYTFDFCIEALRAKKIKFTVENEDESLLIKCDEVKVSQILLNLINNAKDAMLNAKTEDKRIFILVQKNDNFIDIQVSDTGPGIPPEIASKMMNAFFTTKKIGQGSGLGLSLVDRFVKDHGGTVSLLDSAKGACFKVSLPLYQE